MSEEADLWPLPASWRWVTASEIAEIVGGGTPSTTDDGNFGGDIPWITPADLSGYTSRYIAAGARSLTQRGLAGSGARLVPKGTVLFSSRAPIGYVAIANVSVATNQGFRSFVLDPGVTPEYVYYYLQRARPIARAMASGTTFKELSGTRAGMLPVPVPPEAEQSIIVEAIESYFTRLDEAVAGLERVQRNLERYRASVLQAAVGGRLVPTEAELARAEGRDYEPASALLQRILAERRRRWEEAGLATLKANGKPPKDDSWKAKYEEPGSPDTSGLLSLPEGWCWTTADVAGDVLLGRQRAPMYLTGRWSRPYLRVANIKDDRIDVSDVESMDFEPIQFAKYSLEAADILVSEGQSPHLVGQSAIYRGGIKGLCFQKTLHRFRAIPGGPSPEFAQTVFRSHVRTGVFRRLASITTNIAHLTLVKFKASPFPLPPLAEQKRIVAETARLLSVSEEAEAEIARQQGRASRLRQSILKWAFEGKLVDQDPNDEPTDALLARVRAEREAEGATKSSGRRGGRKKKREA